MPEPRQKSFHSIQTIRSCRKRGVKYEWQVRERGLRVMGHSSLRALLISLGAHGPWDPFIPFWEKWTWYSWHNNFHFKITTENVSAKRSAYLWVTMENFLSDNVINIGGLWHTVNFEMFKFHKCLQLKTHEVISRTNCSVNWRMLRGGPSR